MLILFVGDGRLGNQVFQYAALSSFAPEGSRILAVGLEDLEKMFELGGPGLRVLASGLWRKRFVKYLVRPLLLYPLARWLRLISYAREREHGGAYAGNDGRLDIRRGLFRGVLFVDGGYYQNSEYWPQLFPPRCLRLRAQWRDAAQRAVPQLASCGAHRPFFLHVRRGDYVGFSSHGVSNLMLPTEFFRAGIARIRAGTPAGTPGRLLIVVTDDARWAESELADIPGKRIVSSSPWLDFAVMAECESGIVSNSTFSLAAALFMREPVIVIAPRYWFGFRQQQWLPPRIRFEHARIEYLAVPEGAP